MESNDFNTGAFQWFLIQELGDLQRGEMTEAKRGAISEVLKMEEEFQRLVSEMSQEERFVTEDGDTEISENN